MSHPRSSFSEVRGWPLRQDVIFVHNKQDGVRVIKRKRRDEVVIMTATTAAAATAKRVTAAEA